MTLSDSQRLELNELCNRLVDGVWSEADKTRLETLLAQSEEARRFYVRAMGLSASLFEFARESQLEGAPGVIPFPRQRVPWWAIGILAAAALVVVAFWLGDPRSLPGPELTSAGQELDESVARISGAHDCHWTGSTLSVGDELRRGQAIELGSGLAEITFDSGAQLILEGPGALTMSSAWGAVLHRGTLKASVPPEAIGFRISNPAVEVIDLGTEFSMVADGNGATEVFVLKGAVEATASSPNPKGTGAVVLHEEQARRFALSGGGEVPDREQKLRKLRRKFAFERSLRPVHWVQWHFDEDAGSNAHASAQGGLDPAHAAQLAGSAEAVRIAGRWQGALELDGSVSAHAKLSGLNPTSGRTFAFWIKIAANAELPDAGTILSTTLNGKTPRQLEISWNRNPSEGALGALRTNLGRGYVIGTTSLRDGQWHHLAVVLGPKPRGEAKLQIKQYVDGRLEGTSGRHVVKRRDQEVVAADELLWIGRNPRRDEPAFRGGLDELFVADRILAPREIIHLRQFNELPPERVLAGS